MTQSIQSEAPVQAETRLPRRDFFLLPGIGLLTILFMLASAEIFSRIAWPEQENDPCAIADASGHSHFRPNCKSRIKSAEGPWVDNSYNECGYHTLESCGPKRPGTVRIAVLGSSFSFGYLTPYDQTYTSLSGRELTNQCKQNVEFQNLGVLGVSLNLVDTYRRMDEALALKPDVLLVAITPFDVTKEISPEEVSARNEAPVLKQEAKPAEVGNWLRNRVMAPIKQSRAVLMLQHYMFESPLTFANLYMFYGDNADYLRRPISPRWQQRYSNLDTILGDMSRKAKAASVPMVVFIGPSTAQAALLNSHSRPGVDPAEFDTEVAAIGAKYGILVVDPLSHLENRADVMSLFYPVDGHFNAEGQRVLADVLEQKLLASGYPAFAPCSPLK